MGILYQWSGEQANREAWRTLWAAMSGLLPALFPRLGTTATHLRKWLRYIQRPLAVVGPGASTLLCWTVL